MDVRVLKIPTFIIGVAYLAVIAAYSGVVPTLEPSSNQVKVSTTSELVAAIAGAVKGRTIMLADGTYDISSVEPLRIRTDSVTLYGASRDPAKVILKGQGFAGSNTGEEAIKIEATNTTLAYITLTEVRANGLKIQSGANHNLLVHNMHFIDICERSIKGPDAPVSNNGVIRYCLFEQKTPITSSIPNLYDNGDYIAGMDMMKINGWRIHDNTFKNIRGRNGGGRAGIFLWKECKNVVVERNVFVGCDRAISFGNPSSAVSDMDSGIVRNNFIVAGVGNVIEICNSTHGLIAGNTIFSTNPAYSRTVFMYRGGVGNVLKNNLVLGKLYVQSGEPPDSSNNLFITAPGAVRGWFRDTSGGDLHLMPAATGAIDKGTVISQVVTDFDGSSRDAKPDIGADEWSANTPILSPPQKSRKPRSELKRPKRGKSWGRVLNSSNFEVNGTRLRSEFQ